MGCFLSFITPSREHIVNLVVADDLPASAIELLSREGWNVDARSGRAPEQLAADLANADAIVVRSATKVTAALIAAAPRLRVIACRNRRRQCGRQRRCARGIVVMNASASSVSVAELT